MKWCPVRTPWDGSKNLVKTGFPVSGTKASSVQISVSRILVAPSQNWNRPPPLSGIPQTSISHLISCCSNSRSNNLLRKLIKLDFSFEAKVFHAVPSIFLRLQFEMRSSVVRDTATNYCLYSSGSKSLRLCQHTGLTVGAASCKGLKSISKQRQKLSRFFSSMERQQTPSVFSIWWNCVVKMKHAACNLPKWLGMEKFMYGHLLGLEEKISRWIMIIFPRTGIQNLLIANHKKGGWTWIYYKQQPTFILS